MSPLIRRIFSSGLVLRPASAALACVLVFSLSPVSAQPDIQLEQGFELVIDQSGDGEIRRGDTVEFDLTVTNQGSGNALAVEIGNALHEHLDLDAASIEISPMAVDDEYPNVPGNTTFSVAAVDGLLANDRALYPEGGTPPGLEVDVADSDSNSAEGGSVALNTDGSFEYTPPADYEGPDSFNYTLVNDHSLTDTATVHLEVTEPVLYVSNSSSTGIAACDNAQYADIQSAIDAFDDEDEIRVCAGNGAYEQDETLLVSEGVVLLGEPAWRGAGSRPTIRAGGGHDGDSPLIELFDNTHFENFELDVIADQTINMTQSEDVLIRGNRFFSSDSSLDEVENLIRLGHVFLEVDVREGWLAILDNEFELDDLSVDRGLNLEARESTHEILIADNIFSGGHVDELVYVRTAPEGDGPARIILEVSGNDFEVGLDLHADNDYATVAYFMGQDETDIHFKNNKVRVLGGIDPSYLADAVSFFANFQAENCIVLEDNDVLLESAHDDAFEYFFSRDDSESDPSQSAVFYLVGLEDDTHAKLEEFIQAQDVNGTDIGVITELISLDDGSYEYDVDGAVDPGPPACSDFDRMPVFD